MPTFVPDHLGPRLVFLVVFAVALNLATPLAGAAQQKPKRSQAVCNCQCDAGSAGIKESIYPSMASCGGYEGKTCNYEGPDHIIRTGTVRACHSDHRGVDAAAAIGPHSAGVLLEPDAPTTDLTKPVRPDAARETMPR